MSICEQVTSWDDEIYESMLYEQMKAISTNNLVPCRCGRKYALRRDFYKIFRCFFCGEIFCRVCAAEHFGRTSEIIKGGGDGI